MSTAFNFFNPLMISIEETVLEENEFQKLRKGSLPTFESCEVNSDLSPGKIYWKTRMKSFSDKDGVFGRKAICEQDKRKYNKYVWEKDQELRKQTKLKYFARHIRIAEDVVNKSFGNYKITKPPSECTIRNILTAYRKKISS
jgi:hypothetical protein